ncbi:MAG: metallophosphoesterase family protein [Candidatus Omnitrophica bacterium]|nr:metallophosphoesterase family protein [Candidatus Omnitrophota bacterium]
MRYALISDIHGNLEALEAVVAELSRQRIGEYLCIGDVVGYGADPSRCIDIVRSLKPKALIAGNHEWGVTGFLGLDYFSEYASAAIVWTKKILNPSEIEYLKSFKLVYEGDDFILVHGGLTEPEKFPYIMDSDDALRTMKLMKRPISFVGHTHAAEIYYSDKEKARETIEPRVLIESGKLYVVNIGSVGQPRDMDPRASYALYDSDKRTVEIRRVAYDIEKAKAKILKAGLPSELASRLAEGR